MGDLMSSEENSQFPPRFIVNVARNYSPRHCRHLDTKIKVTLYNTREVYSKTFKLYVPLSLVIMADCSDLCDENKATLPKLMDFVRKISPNWEELALKLELPEHEVEIINHDHRYSVVEKCKAMFKYWLRALPPASWCCLVQALYAVGLYNVAEEVTAAHLQIFHSSASGIVLSDEDKRSLEDKEDILNLDDFIFYLKPILRGTYDWRRFVLKLLPHHNAVRVIKKIRVLIRSGGSKADIMSRIGKAFLKVKNPSWTKVYKALKAANYDKLAERINTCFLPI